jgi:hypothetical protein
MHFHCESTEIALKKIFRGEVAIFLLKTASLRELQMAQAIAPKIAQPI